MPEPPALAAIEMLSPGGQLSAIAEKLEEFRAWVCRTPWAANPVPQQFFDYIGGLAEVPELRIAELGVVLQPAAIFE